MGLFGAILAAATLLVVMVAVRSQNGALDVGVVPTPASQDAPSIVLVSLDTLRADRLGALGNTRGLTPNLDAFANEAVVYERAWAVANITSMSHASLFTSQYASEVGPVGQAFRLSGDAPTLAGVLGVYGYETAAFTGAGHLSRAFGLQRGFKTFEAEGSPLGSLWHAIPKALTWLDDRQSNAPFLLFVHGYDVHAPYLKPSPFGMALAQPGFRGAASEAVHVPAGTDRVYGDVYFRQDTMNGFLHERARSRIWDHDARLAVQEETYRRRGESVAFHEEDARFVRDVYDGATAYADALFGELLQGLKSRGLLDRTVVVVLSDHGETLWENGRFGHGDSLDDRELHVPLLVRVPGLAHRRVSADVTLLDVMPTLLELSGATAPAGVRGVSLVPSLMGQRPPAQEKLFAEGCTRMISLRSPEARLSFSGVGADSPFLESLLSTAAIDGPAFEVDTTTDDSTIREPLRQELLGWRKNLSAGQREQTPADPAAVEALRRHGYWGTP
jgi:arylsulfatase A-like enzyme